MVVRTTSLESRSGESENLEQYLTTGWLNIRAGPFMAAMSSPLGVGRAFLLIDNRGKCT